jgi:ribosomal protein S18 acetylase RimI-like enzyme
MTVSLRPESPADEDFIRRLVVETVGAELGAGDWPEPMRSHLLGIQYAARRESHRVNFPGAASQVIEADGAAAGWVVVATMLHEMRVVDIMVLAEMRGCGIGTAVLRGLLATAAAPGKPIRLNVSVMNDTAIRLYERLGFRRIESDEAQHLMEANLGLFNQSQP